MFNKANRLSKTKDVKATFARGRGFFNPLFSVRFLKKGGQRRFTVVVSTKVSKKATDRNRIKRKVRELIRLNIQSFFPGDYVIDVRPKAANFPEKEMLAKLEQFLKEKRLYNQ